MSVDNIVSSCGLICQEQNTADVYQGVAADHSALLQWCTEKCVPLVRELTFENAEVIFLQYSICIRLYLVMVIFTHIAPSHLKENLCG